MERHPFGKAIWAIFSAGFTMAVAILLNQLALAVVLWVVVGAIAVALLEGAYWADHRLNAAPQVGNPLRQQTPAPSPIPYVPPAPPEAPREFTHVSLQFLFQLGKTPNLTDAQTRKLALSYQGQWIPVEGVVDTVDSGFSVFRPVGVVVTNPDMSTDRVQAYFRDQFDRIDALPKGAPIRLVGQIDRVSPYHLILDPCELA
jgi:hypothetical protein